MHILKAYKVKVIGGCYSVTSDDKVNLASTKNVAKDLDLKDLQLFATAWDAAQINFCGDMYEHKDGGIYLCEVVEYNNPVTHLVKK